MQFEGFAGNAALKTALSAAFSRRRLPHTLLLQGEAGLGKRTLAQILARAAVCTCENRDLAPCGVCPACIRAKAGSHPDIRIVTGSGKSNTISVASVDEVIRDAYKKPEEADIKVYCIFAENPMPEITQNKLLKVIEEPPTGALFIFTVLSADALLPTIRSRAQIFTVRPPRPVPACSCVPVIPASLFYSPLVRWPSPDSRLPDRRMYRFVSIYFDAKSEKKTETAESVLRSGLKPVLNRLVYAGFGLPESI